MINGPLIIDRGDGCTPRQYTRIELIQTNEAQNPRWMIIGLDTVDQRSMKAIVAYTHRDHAELVITDLLQGGRWSQFGRSFTRHPH
jgi:hypothetical protein